MIFLRFTLVVIFMTFFVGCDLREHPGLDVEHKKELLIYCGMTMIKPVMEIIKVIEDQENCKIKLSYGGSGHIKRSVEVNEIGDIFFPGSETYIEKLKVKGIVINSKEVGYNQAAVFVQKGNPKKLSADLNHFTNLKINSVIGAENSGSIGRETKKILSKFDLYEKAVENAIYLTTDSKGLVRALRTKDADIIINWRATYFIGNNNTFMEMIAFDEKIAKKKKLVMGLLKYTKHRAIAEKFIDYASGPAGQAIFRKYGFSD